MHRLTSRRWPGRLQLIQLESRETPAGTVSASFAEGVLILTGDDASNSIQLTQVGTDITVTGTDTIIVGGPTLNGVTSIRATMKGGDDIVGISELTPFSLSGAANFDLGDGDNALNLRTMVQLTLGSLSVIAGDGDDNLSVVAPAGSAVTGNLSLDLTAGDTTVDLVNVAINGAGGFKYNAADGDDILTMVGVDLIKGITVSTGLGRLRASIDYSTMSDLSLAANGINPQLAPQGIDAMLTGVDVTGAVKLKSQAGASLGVNDLSAASLSVTGGKLGAVVVTASGGPVTLTTGGLTVHGRTSRLFVSPGVVLDVNTDIVLPATHQNHLEIRGTVNARSVRLTTSQSPEADGQALVIASGGAAIALVRDIAITGRFADLRMQDSSVTARNAILTASHSSFISQSGAGAASLSLAGSLTVQSPDGSIALDNGDMIISGNLTLAGTEHASVFSNPGTTLEVTGTMSIAAGNGTVYFQFQGTELFVGQDLIVKGQYSEVLHVVPATASGIGRNVTFTLGNDDDTLIVNENLAVLRNVTINAGAGNNSIGLGTNTANFAVGGNLRISALGGDDSVTLSRPAVTGTTRITTGAGADLLQMNGLGTFTGATTIDLGTGDDTWNAANDPATSTDRVTFTGTVTAKLGAGNDTLRLGVAVASGGNANTTVDFSTSSANKIDGGTGLNFYDDEAAQLTGTVAIVNFTDPTP